jgi:phytoene synthase
MATSLKQNRSALAQTIDAPLQSSTAWDVESSYAYCEQLARSHYENFPVGSVLVPKRLRKYFYSIYAFARTADDFADEGYNDNHSEAERLALLDEWQLMLQDCFAGRVAHPIFIALNDTRQKCKLPISLFEDLLSAFSQDVVKRRYQSFNELLDYCRRSANPIGRLILLLFGYTDESLHILSDHICTGLQLANHWQDVAIDLQKDRVYLPEDDLQAYGLSIKELQQQQLSPAFLELMKFEVERARQLFAKGKPLCTAVNGRLAIELRVVWLGGSRILDGIEANGYDIFNKRPVITKRDKISILFTALIKGAFRRT